MYIERKLESIIKKYLDTPEIIAITGPRQSGKTTLIQKILEPLKNTLFITFEDIRLRSLFDEDIDTFCKLYIAPYKYICIDEFQYSQAGGQGLKMIYDTFPGKKIFITGSSSIDLTVKMLGFLVGRIFIFQLFPFDFEEYLSYKDRALFQLLEEDTLKLLEKGLHQSIHESLNRIFKEYCIYGGYPRVVLSNHTEEKRIVLNNLYHTLIMRDVRDFTGLKEDYKLNKLIKALAFQAGNIISYNELSQLSEFSFSSLKSHLGILEKIFVINMVSPFYTNGRTELVKAPKVYFVDPGLRNEIASNFSLPDDRGDKGALQEIFLYSECLKKGISPNFWRSKSNAEVDFVWEVENKRIAMEAKSKIKPGTIPLSLKSFMEKYQPETVFIVNESVLEKRNNVIYLPYYLFPVLYRKIIMNKTAL